MKKQFNFVYYNDPSHGWYAVPKWIVKALKVPVSYFSYESKTLVYLEEDSDFPKFMKAFQLWTANLNKPVTDLVNIKSVYSEKPSRIRNLNSYKGDL